MRPTNRTRPGIRLEPESDQNRNPKSESPKIRIVSKNLFRVVHPRNASKHFSLEHPCEQFNLDLLVLRTFKYEIMGFRSTYILQDSDLSYLCGISQCLGFLFSQTSYLHNFICSCLFHMIFTPLPKIFTTSRGQTNGEM